MTTTCTRTLVFTCIAPAAALLPAVMPSRAQGVSLAESVALHARFDPSLGSLRAGGVGTPASFAAHERSELRAAQGHCAALAALRAGSEPTDDEWKWLAIGAGIVVLLIIIL